MEPDRYRVVKEAFAEVVRAPAPERERVLRRVCGDDAELRREVEALLEYDRSAPDGNPEGAPGRGDSGAPSSFEGDFPPGQVLIGRYRIVSLIGEGGMGRVYLADDLVLGQPVAVKFLPEHLAEHPGGLERFRAEVRHAREVTHPNVARVHDIGETEGRPFLTMEYVDGEDLASLIKRIGRLPREKASEIAQQVCSGLAEAHRKGLLHRDLKPANVMLDGEGRVRLTDFGLAVAAEHVGEAGTAGTPQYMAPEQLAGLPASVRSEVYALGLLLYELYTGKRALRGRTLDELRREHEEGGPRPPSTQLADLDPTVDAVLKRCLERDPADRPRSVSEVARALPGGDPLAAALAAGETPAPDVVAAAVTRGGLSRPVALSCLLGAAGLVVLGRSVGSWSSARTAPFYGKPPAVLAERAREIATQLTGGLAFAHEAHWPMEDGALAGLLQRDDLAPGLRLETSFLRNARYGPEPIVADGFLLSVDSPAPVHGSAHVVLSAGGTLVAWRHTVEAGADTEPGPVDWEGLLALAGYAPGELQPVEPRHVPRLYATERRAWQPLDEAGRPVDGLRLEAAACGSHPVLFEILAGERPQGLALPPRTLVAPGVPLFYMLLTVVGAVIAWHNVRARRADVRGALVVGAFAFAAHAIVGFVAHVPDQFLAWTERFYLLVGYAFHIGARVTIFYLALEPFARKRWPRGLVAWNRLLEGRFGDPAVGREVLIGLCSGPGVIALVVLLVQGLRVLGLFEGSGGPGRPFLGMDGPLQALVWRLHGAGDSVMFAGMAALILVLLRAILKKPWLAGPAFLLTLAVYLSDGNAGRLSGPVLYASAWAAVLLLLLTRVGFLAVVALWYFMETASSAPVTLRPGDWYFPSSLVVLGVLAALGVWSYRAAVSGPPVASRRARAATGGGGSG